VAVTETGRTTERVLLVQIEEARLTLPAAFTLDVLLAVARSSVGVAAGSVVDGPDLGASAALASVRTEVVMVGLASVALVACHSGLALAFSFGVALQEFGTDWIAVAG